MRCTQYKLTDLRYQNWQVHVGFQPLNLIFYVVPRISLCQIIMVVWHDMCMHTITQVGDLFTDWAQRAAVVRTHSTWTIPVFGNTNRYSIRFDKVFKFGQISFECIIATPVCVPDRLCSEFNTMNDERGNFGVRAVGQGIEN